MPPLTPLTAPITLRPFLHEQTCGKSVSIFPDLVQFSQPKNNLANCKYIKCPHLVVFSMLQHSKFEFHGIPLFLGGLWYVLFAKQILIARNQIHSYRSLISGCINKRLILEFRSRQSGGREDAIFKFFKGCIDTCHSSSWKRRCFISI